MNPFSPSTSHKKETILVVGGAGYIGSHMVKLLQAEGYRVIVLDDLSTGFRSLVLSNEFIEGRLGDKKLVAGIFDRNRIDAVMHFAAFSLVGESVLNPLKYFGNNVGETAALLEIMVQKDVKKFIFSSSAAVYGEPEKTPIGEAHPHSPTNPYGATKAAVERLLSYCDAAYQLKSICLRYFNAAGADRSASIGELHEPETHLIPLILKSVLSNRPVKIFGTDYPTPDGTCIRDYVHVSDLAQAHLLGLRSLLEGSPSTAYNLGNTVGYSVRQVIRTAEKVVCKKIEVVEEGRRPGDPAVLIADTVRIKHELGWKPLYENLEEIIRTAWNWEIHHHNLTPGTVQNCS